MRYFVRASLYLSIYVYFMCLNVCVRWGRRQSTKVPQSVRQHLVRQASVTDPQGKAAYCGHEP